MMQNGMIFLTSGYNYAVAPYSQCSAPHQGVALCSQYACSLPFNQRAQFQNPQIAQLKTLGNQFGNYQCGKEYQISLGISLLWVGAIIGSAVSSILADDWGRRKALLIAQFSGVIGLTVTILAPSLIVAEIGMCILGGALTGFFAIVLCFLRKILEVEAMQVVATFVQMFYPLGAAIVISFYA